MGPWGEDCRHVTNALFTAEDLTALGLAAFKETDPSIGCESKGGINRLEVRFDDGTVVAIGGSSTECQAGSFGLDHDELFSEVFSNIAGSNPDGQGKMGWGHYSHRDKDKIKWNYLKDEYNPGAIQQSYRTGGGLLIGLIGYQQGDILQTVVPIFSTAQIDHVTRGNVFYTTKDLEGLVITSETLATGSWVNTNDQDPIDFVFSGNTTITSTYVTRWPHSVSEGREHNIKLAGGWRIPRLFAEQTGSSMKTRWELSHEVGDESGQTERQTLKWSAFGTIGPGKVVTCKADTAAANGSFTVTSDVTIQFKDGTSWTYPSVDEIYGSSIAAMSVITTCLEMELQSTSLSSSGMLVQESSGLIPGAAALRLHIG